MVLANKQATLVRRLNRLRGMLLNRWPITLARPALVDMAVVSRLAVPLGLEARRLRVRTTTTAGIRTRVRGLGMSP